VITAVVLEGRSQAEVARAYGVSKGWVSKLIARYRAEGEAAFEPRSRRPTSSPSRTAPEVVRAIVRLRRQLIRAGHDAGAATIVLLRDADIALYQAKGGGKNRYELFHPEMQSERGRRMMLEFELWSALSASQFHLVYQPIYNLDDLAIVGVEALLRWESPSGASLR
jgi:transposase-like protein